MAGRSPKIHIETEMTMKYINHSKSLCLQHAVGTEGNAELRRQEGNKDDSEAQSQERNRQVDKDLLDSVFKLMEA